MALSYRLWNGQLKQVEGHFGTAVVSYFVYLRWLFIMNLIIFALWFGLVVIPNAIYLAVDDPPRTASQLSCAYSFSVNSTISCSNDTAISDNDTLLYLLTETSCIAPSNSTTFDLKRCETSLGFINGTERDIADRESSSTVTVSTLEPDCDRSEDIQRVRLCSADVAPYIPWYQYVIDFALGQGIFNETVLFYGRYGNTTSSGYNLPVAYLFLTGVVYAVSIVLLVYR